MGEIPYGLRILDWAGGASEPERFVVLGGMRLPVEPDPAELGRALDAIVARHTVLGEGPVSLLPASDVWSTAAAGRYPPDSRCLLWAYLDGRDLLLVAHHSVADPWSMRLLLREVLTPGSGPVVGYHDRIETVPESRLVRAVPYWRDVLTGVPTPPSNGGGTSELRMPTGIRLADAAAVAREARTTAFVVLLTAFAQALDSGDELLLPVLTYGRQRGDWDTVGLFMNVLPVRIWDRRLTGVHQAFAEAYAYEIPFPVLLDTVADVGRLFEAGGPALAQFEVIQVPKAEGYQPLTEPAGLGLGGPVLPVNGLVFWLEPGADGTYTACVRYRGVEAEASDLVQRFLKRWEAIGADTRGA